MKNNLLGRPSECTLFPRLLAVASALQSLSGRPQKASHLQPVAPPCQDRPEAAVTRWVQGFPSVSRRLTHHADFSTTMKPVTRRRWRGAPRHAPHRRSPTARLSERVTRLTARQTFPWSHTRVLAGLDEDEPHAPFSSHTSPSPGYGSAPRPPPPSLPAVTALCLPSALLPELPEQ